MSDGLVEVRRAADSLSSVERRLHRRSEQMAGFARRLRRASGTATFVAPAGDRSREFVEAQARRLDRLAERHRDLAVAVRRLSSSLRPRPPASLVLLSEPVAAYVDWDSSSAAVEQLLWCCPRPERPAWDAVTSADDPEFVLYGNHVRPRPGTPWWRTPLDPLYTRPPVGSGWRLDLDEIAQLTKQLRAIGRAVGATGPDAQRDLREPHPALPARLRAALERVGAATARVCADVEQRLHRHALSLDKRVSTPGLLGPSPSYGLTTFGVDHYLPHRMPENRRLEVFLPDRAVWWDRARELNLIMTWLCRRLPVVFGPAADDLLALVGLEDNGPPASRPPAALPPMRYEPPPEMTFTYDLITDPATGIMMGRDEYYRRYGVPYRRPPAPVVGPVVPDGAHDESGSESDDTPDDSSWEPETQPESVGEPAEQQPVMDDSTSSGTGVDDPVQEADQGDGQEGAGPSSWDADSHSWGTEADAGTSGSGAGGGWRSSSDQPSQDQPPDAAAWRTTAAAGNNSSYSGGSAGAIPYAGSGGYGGGTADSGYATVSEGFSEQGLPTDAVEEPVVPEPVIAPPDDQVAHDVTVAASRGGVRVTTGAGAALGSVLVGGGAVGTAVLKRNAARKVTSWTRYKVLRPTGSAAQQEER